jgi:hypothetical protein
MWRCGQTPALIRHTFGTRDPDIYYEWRPLWQIDEVQRAQITPQKAQASKIDADSGLVPRRRCLKAARIN